MKGNLRRKQLSKKLSLSFFGALAIAASIIAWNKSMEEVVELHIEEIYIQQPGDVLSFSDSLVRPVLYRNVDELDTLDGAELKQKFIQVILPAIMIAKHRIEKQRENLVRMNMMSEWQPQDSVFYKNLADEYDAENIEELITKMHTHPNSVVLAQAAMESGWGTSRFFRKANNLFGVWSFDPDEPRIQAGGTRNGKPVYVRKYDDLSESIEDYFKVLARSNAYKSFREERLKSDDPFKLVNHLVKYSEMRWEYVRLLKVLIRKNDLIEYDSYELAPQYFVTIKRFKWWS